MHYRHPLEHHLNLYISLDYGFDLAYGYLRPHWTSNLETVTPRMGKAQSKDAALHREAFDCFKRCITDPRIPSRRVWDLDSNPVIPYHWRGGDPQLCVPVSHSWFAVDERSNVWTQVKGREWRVRDPSNSCLERVRIELLNHITEMQRLATREYLWLDVLCLRHG